MISSERRFREFYLAIIIVMSFFCVQEVYGGDGWYKTKWGMSPDEVREAMASKMEVLSDGLMLRGFDISGIKYDVGFCFDKNMRLKTVALNCQGNLTLDDQYRCFLQLKDALKAKYGQPTMRKPRITVRNQKTEMYEWLTKDTSIVLTYSVLPAAGTSDFNYYCYATYKSRKVDEKF